MTRSHFVKHAFLRVRMIVVTGVHFVFIVHSLNMDDQVRSGFWWTLGSFFWELVKAFILAMVIIVPIRYFLVQPFFVRGASMEPTFYDSEYLIIDQLSYRFYEPKRGDVIVFRYPEDPSQFFIKRIIGLPGDDVRVDDGRVFISNSSDSSSFEVDEHEYLSSGIRTGGNTDTVLGQHEYYVLGDNRSASSDSRSWGAVSKANIMGRVWIRAWPLPRFSIFDHTEPSLLAVP